MPLVVTGFVKAEKVSLQYSSKAKIVYGTQQYNYFLDFDVNNVALIAKNRDEVKIHSPLFRVSVNEVLIAKKNLEINILDIKAQDDELLSGALASTGRTGGQRP